MFGGGDEPAQPAGETVAFSSSSFVTANPAAGGDFWGTELSWQRAEMAKAFAVSISDPQTVSGGFMSSYTVYVIKSSVCPDGVKRRYSDFDWLRDLLVARFHGIAVPLMPEKRLVGNQGRAFIEERMQGLEQFMLLVLANPYLRNDATLRMFLTQGGSAEFEQAKKAASGGVGADPASNPGLARWFGVLRSLPLPVDADAACHELQASTDEMEARVVAVLSAVTRYWESSKASADALRSMRDALGDWATSASSGSSAMSETLRALKEHTGALAGRVKKGADAFSNAHDLSVFAPNEIQIFLLDGLVTETHRLRSLKALLGVREAAQKAYSAAWVGQDKLHFQVKQWRDKGREDKAVQLEPKVAEAVGIMRRMKERLDDITKGLLHLESDKAARARTVRFVAMTGQYAALCIASGVRTQELWGGFLQTMELDQAGCVADAQATLTGQASMHGLDAVPGTPISLLVPQAALASEGVSAAASPAKAAPSAAPPADLFAASPAPASDALFTGSAASEAPSATVDM